jgi:NSS family neurotransmitter:Na+ symporter
MSGKTRERWGSKLGIIMAVAGSAVGLGNFLRFPSVAAQNGGGAFMIPYLVALLLLGLPLMWIEWTIGRFGGGFGHSTAPGMFHTMSAKNRFIKAFGVIGIFGPIAILMYYLYVESWLLGYGWFAATGKLGACETQADMKAFLLGYTGCVKNAHFSSLAPAYGFFLLTFVLNLFVLHRGIRGGIERVCKCGMPLLFVLGLLLMGRVFTLGTPDPAKPDQNVLNGLGFLWNPDWKALADPGVWLAAAGQIFFTLSVGIGVILTYASYLKRDDDVALSGLTAASTNEMAEVLMGGSIVIPAAFVFLGQAGTMEAAKGGTFNLGFFTMPMVLEKLPLSNLLGVCWFLLLFIAGITSSISLAQPAIAFLEDEFDLTRKQAVGWFGLITFLLCQPGIFFFANGVVDEIDFWAVNVCLVSFGLVEVILFAWIFGMDRAWTELHAGSDITIPRVYRFVIKYVTPLILAAILGAWLFARPDADGGPPKPNGLDMILLRNLKPDDPNLPHIVWTRLMLLGLLVTIGFLVWHAGRTKRASGEEARP